MDQLLHYIVQLDEYLAQAVEALGPWAYGAIFLTIFCETGLVVLPFLPGESLLLTSGTLAGAGVLNIVVLWPLLVGAAFLGDVVNYLIGRWLGKHLLSKPRKYLKPKHVQEAQEFYEEHGGLAIVACRFLPIVRTLVPFVAGVTKMEFHRYLFFAFVAAVVWVTIFLGAGYLFGNVPWVQDYLGNRPGHRRRRLRHPRLHHLGGALRAAAAVKAGGLTGRGARPGPDGEPGRADSAALNS